MKKPENVFKGGFLETYGRRDESSSSSEAVLSGRWKIVERDGTIALFREWENESIDPPFATFHLLDHALLFAAVAPASTRPPDYETAEEGDGVFLFCDGREVGRLRWGDAEIVDVLNVAAYLVRNPAALALLLEAAGPSALEAAGRLLYQRTMKKQRAGQPEPE
jgi:hypothetical protein